MFLSRLALPEKLAFYSLAHAVAAAQSDISAVEEALLDAALGEMALATPPALQDIQTACSAISSATARRVVLLELLMIALIDGDIVEAELAIVCQVAELLGLQVELKRARDWATAMLTVYRSGERFISSPA